MTTTEQRSGFRLPWASDPRPEARTDDQAPPDSDSAPAADAAAVDASSDPEATDVHDATTIPDPQAPARPDTDAPAEPGSTASAPEPPPTRTRRDNPLVAGLVRAMRDAAATARQEAAARFAED